ncbi:MAG: hypothetical protein ACK46L_15335 [Synechococcaceae cyanobacterium]|jgi:hypothetical protein
MHRQPERPEPARRGQPCRQRWAPRLLTLLAALWLTPAAPAKAGLLRPVLMLMRPQLESRLARICVQATAGGRPELEASLRDPCQKLAVPTSKCLVEETDNSGRGLGVLSELLAGRFGDDSEDVVKRCLARMFGLPVDSLREVPLREIGRRFLPYSLPPTTAPAPNGQAGPGLSDTP